MSYTSHSVYWAENIALNNIFYSMWGMWLLKVTGKGQGCVAVSISDSIFWLFYFTPMLVSQCNPLPKKVPKELYKRKDSNRQETKAFLLYFPLFTWFNIHSMDEGVFPEYIEMFESPFKVSKNMLIIFMYACVRIWYFGLP